MKPTTEVERWLLQACEVVTGSAMVTPPEGREAAARDAQKYLFVPATALDQLRRAVANHKNAATPDLLATLRLIAEFPIPEQDNMVAANMRKVAWEALARAGGEQ